MSKRWNVPSLNLDEFEVNPEVLRLVPKAVCQRHMALPVNRAGNVLILAMTDPSDWKAVAEVESVASLRIEIVHVNEEALVRAFARYYGLE